ncbi:uncharacterized protein LOC125044138 [Penaeus chinensis]|uniref:uncharacterized protein LOC125044138 n=1 Tax=Penaeus chinensis TaxID=139456 RepID=UPI001FB80664|nr:uncharacterized protein LOC125044138 [Penaeus chinensis]
MTWTSASTSNYFWETRSRRRYTVYRAEFFQASTVFAWHYTLLSRYAWMNGRLLIALALGAALIDFAQSIILLATGTAAATTVTVSAAGLAAGAAALGALAVGAAAAVALASRGKREASSCLPFSSPEIYFSMAANSDFLDCGRRYVCELEATADDKLAHEELLIRNLFGRSSSAISGVAGGFFADAGKVGTVNGTAACAQTFSSCPFNRKDIYQAFREIQNTA